MARHVLQVSSPVRTVPVSRSVSSVTASRTATTGPTNTDVVRYLTNKLHFLHTVSGVVPYV